MTGNAFDLVVIEFVVWIAMSVLLATLIEACWPTPRAPRPPRSPARRRRTWV